MRCAIRGLSLLVAILVAGCLVAGCGSAVKSAIGSVTSKTATSGVTTAPPSTPTAAPSTPTAVPSTPTAVPSTPTAVPSTPTTVPSTATTTVTASAPTPTPTTSPSPAESSGTGLIWLWVLLGVVVLGGLITWIARSGRRRSAAAAGWRSRLVDAYAKGSALHDAMSVAEMQGNLASSDAGARWYEIQRRADDLTQTLYALREAASDPGDQARIADVLASLQAVRSAMDAERAPGGASMQQADVVRSRLSGFESSLRALRAGDQQFS
jgi:hypothetical protein